MAYNTKEILKDKDGNPISQYYNETLDVYEAVEGSSGGNKVVLYNEDGTENNSLSLIPILDKLGQLTGTVIDEETRKSNELQRITLYDLIFKMLQDGELKGEQGIQGIQGETGKGLEFYWRGTELGVRVEGTTQYVYVDLKGETGSVDNLTSQSVIDALGYTPFNPVNIINTLTETIIGKALDATQGKIVDDKIKGINSRFSGAKVSDIDNISSELLVRMFDSTSIGRPSDADGLLLHIGVGDFATQYATTLGTNDLYHRTKYGSWRDWKRVITNTPIPWIRATLQNGWEGNVSYRKNELNQLEIVIYISGGVRTWGTIITTLPIEYRPQTYASIFIYHLSSGSHSHLLVLNADGTIQIREELQEGIYSSNNVIVL